MNITFHGIVMTVAVCFFFQVQNEKSRALIGQFEMMISIL